MIAALFVQAGGVYAGLDGVELWGRDRDARRYAGPWPVVAHPPCERWGRFWSGGPSGSRRFGLGEDDGCFAAALGAVRAWGGVLEHPVDSHAWTAFGLTRPPHDGGWVYADFDGGWTCCVDQGRYGHPSRKRTWLYCNGTMPPALRWGAAPEGRPVENLSRHQREATPPEFRDLLLTIASAAEKRR